MRVRAERATRMRREPGGPAGERRACIPDRLSVSTHALHVAPPSVLTARNALFGAPTTDPLHLRMCDVCVRTSVCIA